VPGGVGPVALAILMRNTVISLEQTKKMYEKTMAGG